MKHPTAEQLSAFHDGIADEKTLVAVEEHVNQCAECHDVLASLERQDRALAAVLTHDPGDAHFAALAESIERRLGEKPEPAVARGAAGAPLGWPGPLAEVLARAAALARGVLAALGRPGVPKWAGAVAALLLGAGLVLINMKRGTGPTLRNPALEQRSGQAAQSPRAAD